LPSPCFIFGLIADTQTKVGRSADDEADFFKAALSPKLQLV
jgi:hypothetical protein